ncbi:hypothetical protein RJ641_036846 [Dillenia turbinata]|uniref:Uncharacterized protein n=1 Tax=Dillenia turbinata TaxID=194707 RepID=A0AAN8VQQ4_9MAGN
MVHHFLGVVSVGITIIDLWKNSTASGDRMCNNDGDKLSADDQSFVLENVFNYHPDRAVKMGAGVDYVMISKHSSFQDSWCFYIVSTDGHKEDFSYRKCLENFIRGKYPYIAETFIEKYWSRKRKAERDAAVAPSPSVGTS